jgi:hypothetical protein
MVLKSGRTASLMISAANPTHKSIGSALYLKSIPTTKWTFHGNECPHDPTSRDQDQHKSYQQPGHQRPITQFHPEIAQIEKIAGHRSRNGWRKETENKMP